MLRPYRRRLAIAIALSAGAIIGAVLVPLLVGHAVNEIEDGDRSGLALAALALAGAGVLIAVSQGLRQRIAGKISLDVERDVRGRFYGHLLGVNQAYLDDEPVGQLVSRGTVDLRQMRIFLGSGVSSLVQDFGTILLAAIVMFALDVDLALLALSPVPLIIGVVMLEQRATVPVLAEVRRRIGVLSTLAVDNISGVRLVRAFVREPAAIRRYHKAADEMVDEAVHAVRLQSVYGPTIDVLPSLGLVAVLLYGGHQAISGSISVGEFTSFYTYLLMLVAPASRIAYWMVVVQDAMAGAARVNEVLRQPLEDRAPDAPPLETGPGSMSLRRVGVRRRDAEVLSGIDLDVAPRSALGIVGPTGSGKSTLLALVNRLCEADSGEVEVDRRPVREINLRSLRHGTAVAAADDFLFSFSVRENIAYGRPDAGEKEIREAARRAQADDFVAALPQGYDTPVGSRGLALSGGQRERIALARALLMRPRILLLDNATGSLDARTEAAALSELSRHMRDCTTLIVAYRSPGLELTDEVVMLDGGRIVASGSHAQLLAANDSYRDLVGGDGEAQTPAEPT